MGQILVSSLTGVIFLLIYAIQVQLSRRSFSRRNGCDKPPKRPSLLAFLGSGLGYRLEDSRAIKECRTLPLAHELHQKYGKTFIQPGFFRTTVKISDSQNIHAILGPQAKEFGVEPLRLAGMEAFCGRGFLTTDGRSWERSRSLVRPAFHKSNLSDLSDFTPAVNRLLALIPQDGSTIDLQPLILLMFVDTSAQFIFGHPLGALSSEALQDSPVDGKSFLKAWQMSLRSCGIRIGLGRFRFLMSRSESFDHYEVVHRMINFHINQTLNKHPDTRRKHSVLDDLLQETNDKEEVRNEAIQLMMASQDTTAVLLSNAIFLLARNPTIWNRLRDEAGLAKVNILSMEDTKQFRLTRNVLFEALRLYPIFPNLGRIALKDTILPTGGGINRDLPILITAGTTVVADYYSLHRQAELYGSDVDEFRPDRWNSIQPGPWHFMAFGGGQRACLGQQKALAEATLSLLHLAQKFQTIESRDDREWTGEQKLTAKNANGCKVAFFA